MILGRPKSMDFGVRHRSPAAGLVRLAGRLTWVRLQFRNFGIFDETSNTRLIRALLTIENFLRTRAKLKMTHFLRTRAVLKTKVTSQKVPRARRPAAAPTRTTLRGHSALPRFSRLYHVVQRTASHRAPPTMCQKRRFDLYRCGDQTPAIPGQTLPVLEYK